MIRGFYIDNFKSLVDFRLPPPPNELGQFVCLVGLNGAGKSTVLQALDFLAHVAGGKVKEWLELREWKQSDLISQFLKRKVIHFELEFEISPLGRIVWEGLFNTSMMRCTRERVRCGNAVALNFADQKLHALSVDAVPTSESAMRLRDLQGIQFAGSTLSFLKQGSWHAAIDAVIDSMEHLRALDMLSPQSIRRRAKQGHDIGYGGERLSAYLHGMNKRDRQALVEELRNFYPQLEGLSTKALRAGWKDLSIDESYLDALNKPLQTSARHVSDGLLRVLAVLSQVGTSGGYSWLQVLDILDDKYPVSSVLFDEIENGINPELMQKLVEHLLKAKTQVIVTTHSPLVLNYLPDDTAKESVILVFRNRAGLTRAVRFFDLPSVQRKLSLLGPGEVYVDTDLERLPMEAAEFEYVGGQF